MNVEADAILNGQLDADDVEETLAFRGVDQKVEVAALYVVTVEGGAEQARVRHAGLKDEAADGVAMLGEGFGRLHGDSLARAVARAMADPPWG